MSAEELNTLVNEISQPQESEGEAAPDVDEAIDAIGVQMATEDPKDAPAAEQPAKESTEPEKEPEPPAVEAKPDDEPLKDELFTDEALSTKEGVQAARDGILKARTTAEELLRKNHATYLRLSHQQQRFKKTKDETLRMRQEALAILQRNQADASSLTRTGAREVLETLGRLTGRDGLKMLEAMNMAVASDGKHTGAPEVTELRKEIEDLKNTLIQEREQAKQAKQGQLQSFIQSRHNQLAEAAQNTQLYPRLASIAADDPQNVGSFVADVIVEAHNAGQKLTDAQALQLVEKQLQEKLGPPPAAKAEPVRGNGTEKPREAQSPPLGTQIEPAAATHEGAKRSLSDEELDGLTAEQLPADFFDVLGLPA